MEVWIGGAALAVAVLFGALAFWQGGPSRKAAKRDLARRRVLKIELNGSGASQFVWVLPWTEGAAFMVELDITLTNLGGSSVEDVTVELDVASLIYIPELERQPGGAARLAGLQREMDQVEGVERTKVFFNVPAIHPNVAVHIADNLFFPGSSRITSSVEALTKDKVPIKADFEFVYGWAVRLSAHARDLTAIQRSVAFLTLPPDDKLLQPLAQPERAFAELASILRDPNHPQPVSAFVLSAKTCEVPPEEIATALGAPALKRVRLSQADRRHATYFSDVGFLPLVLDKDGNGTVT